MKYEREDQHQQGADPLAFKSVFNKSLEGKSRKNDSDGGREVRWLSKG